jgi:hypothetical protein
MARKIRNCVRLNFVSILTTLGCATESGGLPAGGQASRRTASGAARRNATKLVVALWFCFGLLFLRSGGGSSLGPPEIGVGFDEFLVHVAFPRIDDEEIGFG